MEEQYDREEIDSKISMGEVAFICGEKILDKNVVNRIITSTILQLHLKKYIEFNKDKAGKTIIQIQNSKERLKKTEELILKCLKASDIEADNQLKLEEITRSNNQFFNKNKKQLKDLIIEEAIEDGYIEEKKLKEKQRYFSSIFLMILIMFFLIFAVSSLIRINDCFNLICYCTHISLQKIYKY